MITCEEFAQQVTAYLEGALPMGERVGMWIHKLVCHHCRRYYNQMKQVVDLMAEAPEGAAADGPDEATKRDLLAAFKASKSSDE